ncbi:DUF397 domain-containing protein [Streptacidiphilus cavernicola]|uniref:DUF397 domain-containing protein n=1 Tax=Streptacidiphilus cavernicola TaxID=3342716 RepID=A0ABV6VSD3_9ACTN
MTGTLSNGRQTVPWNNPLAPGAQWFKASDTELDAILKNCVIVTVLPDSTEHTSVGIPNGTRMVGISDDKDELAPVLHFSRAEFTIFARGIVSGQFVHLYASDDELTAAGLDLADVDSP